MLESFRNKRILVVAAHPDDEVLGPGAAIHHLIHNFGCRARALILGEGVTSRASAPDREALRSELNIHRANITDAATSIGYESTSAHDFPDNRFDSVDLLNIVKRIEEDKRLFQPEIIFTHHGGDLNVDHRRTFEAVMTATRPVEGEIVRAVFAFETPSSTEWQAADVPHYFRPNFFITISRADLQAKIKAMESYELERRPFPHPRSPEALETLAKRWGVAVGAHYAEAFASIRILG